MDLLPIISENSCGECTACCTVLGVQALKKEEYVRCEHLCDAGCGIYETRPSECRKYKCMWLNEQMNDPRLRPDNLGIIIEPTQTKFGPSLVVREVWVGAHREELANNTMYQLGASLGAFIYMVGADNTRRALFPPGTEHLASVIKTAYKTLKDTPLAKKERQREANDERRRLKKLANKAKKRNRR